MELVSYMKHFPSYICLLVPVVHDSNQFNDVKVGF
jgi:hypothetical protein